MKKGTPRQKSKLTNQNWQNVISNVTKRQDYKNKYIF